MSRTPKNYDGTASPAKLLGDLLPEWLGRFVRAQGGAPQEVLAGWAETAGPEIAKWTRAASFADGALTIIVKSSTLYSVLSQHEKPRLLAKLRERFPKSGVRNIVFRVG